MGAQLIQDSFGNNTGVFVPIEDWNNIVNTHKDLKKIVNLNPSPKIKLSDLAGKISKKTGAEMLEIISESRLDWERE